MSDNYQACGNCRFATPAYNYDGSLATEYVICSLKAYFTHGRRPQPGSTVSAVYRMHRQRDSCQYWEMLPVEMDETVVEYAISEPTIASPLIVSPPPLDEAQYQEKISDMENKIQQQERRIEGLRNENFHLHEMVQQLRDELIALREKKSGGLFSSSQDFFALLGVERNSTQEEIRLAYREKMKIYHPDRLLVLAQQLNLAYETLMDNEKKRDYLGRLGQDKG